MALVYTLPKRGAFDFIEKGRIPSEIRFIAWGYGPGAGVLSIVVRP